MKTKVNAITAATMLALAAQVANADVIPVADDITTSVTWTSNNVYNLQKQIYVKNGASLTIDAGTVIKGNGYVAGVGAGSLAVTRGSKIFVNGTQSHPVIMTSTNDDMVTWRPVCNEWGNLTIMGKALISASVRGKLPYNGNTATPTGLNTAQMEGLTGVTTNDPNIFFGGNDDNDSSGEIHYLSLRYGGLVLSVGNELNGLSMGGIGRSTKVDHVEVMNNVDDGIETWGGTVNYKYISVWNIGDDNFDVDEGWRGKAQFGLLVQGYAATNVIQGSGIGDNCFEIDGAEDSDAQPVTTAGIYNFTVVGQPIAVGGGDHGVALRDNARVQFRNCIFMDLGEKLVSNDNTDGDNATAGYGLNGTLSFNNTWATSATNHSLINAGSWTPGAFNDPAVLYQAQQADGKLLEIRDSVFYNNGNSAAYTTADSVGVRNASNNNVTASSSPVALLQRAALVNANTNLFMLPVTNINPCAANDALTSVAAAPNDGFYTPAQYRGAFSPNNNWLQGWTAAYAYGMTDTSTNQIPPVSKIQTTAPSASSIFFQTTAGVAYTVEESTDLKNWTPVATTIGDGSIKSVADLAAVESVKFYRTIIQ